MPIEFDPVWMPIPLDGKPYCWSLISVLLFYLASTLYPLVHHGVLRSGFLVVINDAACWSVNSSPTLTDTHLLTGHALGFS
jgi:hypothetical protein